MLKNLQRFSENLQRFSENLRRFWEQVGVFQFDCPTLFAVPTASNHVSGLFHNVQRIFSTSSGLFLHVERVVHTLLFGEEVAMIVLVGSDFHRHIFHNFKTIGFQAYTLHGVVRN